jgi:Zn-dependent protease with chaperone function
MTLSYVWRLVCLSAAVFFLVNLLMGACVALAVPAAIRRAERTLPRRAALLLLVLRMLPAVLAAVTVLAVCVPSYLWLEPAGGAERVGAACLSAAALGLAVCLFAGARLCRAAVRSRRFVRAQSPCLAMAGILRPRLIVSPAVRHTLTAEQFEAALDHERAHWVSRDNLKRLLLLLAPGLLPFCPGFRRLDRAWTRFTEWAADDSAVAGSPARSLSLASALVRVARLQVRPVALPLATSFLGETPDFAARVARLLNPAPRPESPPRKGALISAAAACTLAFAAFLFHPATLTAAHRLLERLME